MRRFAILILIFSVLCSVMTSCSDYADNPRYEDIAYREDGFEIVLTNDMQRYDSEEYDFYFTNILGTVIITASKLDGEFLEEEGCEPDISPEAYVDFLIKKSALDKDGLYYEYDEKRDLHSFRYTYAPADEGESFYYVCVLGSVGNIWYVEMICSGDDSEFYLPSFEKWKKKLDTYIPEE